MPLNNAITVKQLNLYVKTLLEGDRRLSSVVVAGEISNFKNHYASGHLYFTLKDSEAAIKCVMFRSSAVRLRFVPKDGSKVVLRGHISLYEKDGQYQFYADEMSEDGLGDISLRFEQLKEKLSKEGLFDPENKRPIPRFPMSIAVVTSQTGAAVQDIINILSRRWPVAQIVLCPVSVQGESAVPEMLSVLERVYSLDSVELIIIGRGGGSAEDLWSFNDERLARKIYESPVPVISAVGHETDFTICDFVSDLRAPTPSAAAELAVPDSREIIEKLKRYGSIMLTSLRKTYNYQEVCLKAVLNSNIFKNPVENLIEQRTQRVDKAVERLCDLFNNRVSSFENKCMRLTTKLDTLSPLKVMNRGYSLVTRNNFLVRSVDDVNAGENISIKLSDGTIKCTITDKEKDDARK